VRRFFDTCESAAIAFSGGVDSTFVLQLAHDQLGARAVAVTAVSESLPGGELENARRLAARIGAPHFELQTHEASDPRYLANPANRCYFCKVGLYAQLQAFIEQEKLAVVVDGQNADDAHDHRPGRQAAREFGVRSPLDEVDLTKDEIRQLSRRAGLPTWDEPASACLSSRIPYHSEVTDEKLRMIERAEDVMRDLGFRICRVRHHDLPTGASATAGLARLEIGRDELPRALEPDVRDRLVRELKAIGYEHVTIDLQGYRMGSLNEGLRLRPV
jgi:uncharacterized protein